MRAGKSVEAISKMFKGIAEKIATDTPAVYIYLFPRLECIEQFNRENGGLLQSAGATFRRPSNEWKIGSVRLRLVIASRRSDSEKLRGVKYAGWRSWGFGVDQDCIDTAIINTIA